MGYRRLHPVGYSASRGTGSGSSRLQFARRCARSWPNRWLQGACPCARNRRPVIPGCRFLRDIEQDHDQKTEQRADPDQALRSQPRRTSRGERYEAPVRSLLLLPSPSPFRPMCHQKTTRRVYHERHLAPPANRGAYKLLGSTLAPGDTFPRDCRLQWHSMPL